MLLGDFDALSFDCCGTLIDWESGILGVLVPWAVNHRLGIDPERLLATYAQQEAHVEARTPGARYPEVLARSFTGVGHELNAPVLREDAQRLASSVPGWPAFPDSHDALTSLAERYKLFVLSNIDRESFEKSNEKIGVRITGIVSCRRRRLLQAIHAELRSLAHPCRIERSPAGQAAARRPKPVP